MARGREGLFPTASPHHQNTSLWSRNITEVDVLQQLVAESTNDHSSAQKAASHSFPCHLPSWDGKDGGLLASRVPLENSGVEMETSVIL